MVNFKFLAKDELKKLPKSAGVYCFRKNKQILYIGKALNIQERVKQHQELLNLVKQLGYIKTDSEIEALILEANLIKKYRPKYNIVWRDDKNYFYIVITKEYFPKVFITHQVKVKSQKSKVKIIFIGPFVDGNSLKQTLKILRKVFPYRTCNKIPKKPCLWYQLQRCSAPCLLKSNLAKQIPNLETKLKGECQRNSNNLMKILRGEKIKVLKDLKRQMKLTSKSQDFEKAAKIRDQISTLERVMEHVKVLETKIKELNWLETRKCLCELLKTNPPKFCKAKLKLARIEAYDVSNIQGKLATGSMVTFIDSLPDKNFYRKFRIKITKKPNDVAMLKEILSRRLKHPEWPYPDLILIDGGKAQLNAAQLAISNQQLTIPILALAKKQNQLFIERQRKPILLKNLPRQIFNLILQLRDEAHRFARKYHLKLREIDLRESL